MIDQQENGLAVRYRLLLAACADLRLKPADTRVLSVVLGLMKKGKEYAWPSLKFIGDQSGLDRRTVTRSVGALVDLGYLVRESGDARTANMYRPGVPVGDGDEAPTGEVAPRGEQTPRGDSVQVVGADSSTSVGAATPLYKGLKALGVKAVEPPPSRAALAPAPGNEASAPKPTKPKKPPRRHEDSGGGPPAGAAPPQEPHPAADARRTRSKRAAVVVPEPPEWLDAGAWASWCEYRSKLRGYTTLALELCLKTLAKHRGNGHDPVLLIELAIERGWQGLYTSDQTLAVVQTSRPTARRVQLQQQLASARTDAERVEIYAQLHALGDDDGGAIDGQFELIPTKPGHVPRDARSEADKLAEVQAAIERQRQRKAAAAQQQPQEIT